MLFYRKKLQIKILFATMINWPAEIYSFLARPSKKKKIQHKYNLSSAGHSKGRSSSTDFGNHLDQPSRWQMSGGGVRGVDIRGDPQG